MGRIIKINLNGALNTTFSEDAVGSEGFTELTNIRPNRNGFLQKRPGMKLLRHFEGNNITNIKRWVDAKNNIDRWIGWDETSTSIVSIDMTGSQYGGRSTSRKRRI